MISLLKSYCSGGNFRPYYSNPYFCFKFLIFLIIASRTDASSSASTLSQYCSDQLIMAKGLHLTRTMSP